MEIINLFHRLFDFIKSLLGFPTLTLKGKERTSDILIKSKTIQKNVGRDAINVTEGKR